MNDAANWVRIERSFAAPIMEVWQMWTVPDKFQSWYGPRGMTVPVAEMNLVVGGQRKICMERSGGGRAMSMWFIGVYKEVNAPTRLVYTESMCDAEGRVIPPSSMGMPAGTPDVTEVIIDLHEAGGLTHMTLVHVGVKSGTAGEGGWRQAFDALAERLPSVR